MSPFQHSGTLLSLDPLFGKLVSSSPITSCRKSWSRMVHLMLRGLVIVKQNGDIASGERWIVGAEGQAAYRCSPSPKSN